MDGLWQDVKIGVRALTKNRGFTVVAVVTLALGIGANTAIFSVVDQTLFRRLPYPESQRLVRLYTIDPKSGESRMGASYGDFLDWRRQTRTFQSLATYAYWTFNLTGTGQPERILGARASGNLFSVMQVPALLGRTLTLEDDTPGKEMVVLSYGLWQRVFGGDDAVVGRAIRLNGRPHTVIGVLPSTFRFLEPEVELWGTLAGNLSEERTGRFLACIGRLGHGVTLEQAQADMEGIVRKLELQYPDTNAGWRIQLTPLRSDVTGGVRPTLLMLLGAVGLLLLIACANTANLSLSRAVQRSREISIRFAVGAGRARLARQLLTESALLALVGGGVGSIGAYWGVLALKASGPEELPRLHEIGMDERVLAFALGLSVVTGLLFGLAPAFHVSRAGLHDPLRHVTRTGSSGPGRRWLRPTLVATEIALSLVLAIGAGLLLRAFSRVLEEEPGFNPDRLLTLNVFLTGERYDTIPKQKAFVRAALEGIGSVPGVRSASMVTAPPFGETWNSLSFQIVGREVAVEELPRVDYRAVDPDYFRNMGIPLLGGRPLSERDDEYAPPVVLVNESMARRFWPDEDAIGHQLRWVFQGRGTDAHTIVGVVGDVKSVGLDAEERPAVYAPFTQRPFTWLRWSTFVVRTETEPLPLAKAVRRKILDIDPELPVFGIAGMNELMADSLENRRFVVVLLCLFAALALTLAAVGIYGVMAYEVSQRTGELGVRIALGAQRSDIRSLLLRRGIVLAFLGVASGSVGALALTRLLESLLFEVSATDPATFIAVAALLMVVALLSSYLPARRATNLDPVRVLRDE